MSISFITGKPGGGKGLLTMEQIVEELLKGTRPIITNLAVRVAPWINGQGKPMIGLREYLRSKYGSECDVDKRVFLLEDEDAGAFFLWRVEGGKLVRAEAEIKVDKEGNERVMGFDTALGSRSGPALYVVDEAWKFYGSRNWQRTGEGCLFYSAQHRKFGDDVLIVTQHTKQIDPALYRVAQDFWVVKNHSKMSLGMFRQPNVFSVAIYDQAPTGGQLEPMSRKFFTLDKQGLAQTYDTSAGVGLSGRMVGDAGARGRGLPWWGLPLSAVALLVAVWYFVKGGGWMVGRWMSGAKPHPAAVARTSVESAAGQRGGLEKPVVADPGQQKSLNVGPVGQNVENPAGSDSAPVECRGWCVLPGDTVVFLSDGRQAHSAYGEVQFIFRHSVKCFGETFPVHVLQPGEILPDVPSAREFPQSAVQPNYRQSPVVGELPARSVLPGSRQSASGFQHMAQTARTVSGTP